MNPDDLEKDPDLTLLDAGGEESAPAADASELEAVIKAEGGGEPAGDDTAKPTATDAPVDDAAAAPAAVVDDKTVDRSNWIPPSRLGEVVRERDEQREARLRAEADLAAAQATPAPDISVLERERNEAIYGGDMDKAAEIGVKIYAEVQRQAREEAIAEARQERIVDDGNREYARAYAQCVKDYSFLGYTKDAAGTSIAVNQEAVDDVVALRDLNVAKGLSGPDALIAAAKTMAKVYGKPATPAPENVVAITDKRKAETIRRGAADANAQPAPLAAGVGARAIPAVAMPKSQTEYEALPKAEQERLLA